jgi:rsbT co-antagonist protein RsbR
MSADRLLTQLDRGPRVEEEQDAGLVKRIVWFIRLKLVANAGLALVSVSSYLSQPTPILLAALLVLASDTAFVWPYWLLVRRGYGRGATCVSLCLSAVSLAVGVHLTGGFGNALGAIYSLLVLACGLVTGSVAWSVALAGFSTAVYLFVAGIEYLEILPYVGAPSPAPIALGMVAAVLISIWGTTLASGVFLRALRATSADLYRIAILKKKHAAENARLLAEQEEALARQARLLETVYELSTPIVPLVEGAIALPLVGHVDQVRAHRILDELFDEVARRRPRVVLLDLTGMVGADKVVVEHLTQIVQGVRLLGAEVMLVGVRAALAEKLADLGLDASSVTTQRDMQSGIAFVLAHSEQREELV